MPDLRKGDAVVVRGYLGMAANAVVWDIVEDTVFVCSERQFAQLDAGMEAPHAIGFPVSDVFFPSEDLPDVSRATLSESDWATLQVVG